MTFTEDAASLSDELVALRRAIHADPEVGLDLPRTQRRILDALDGLDLDITLGTSLSSVTAVLRGGRPGPVVLLRGDMDALPVQEETGLEFASQNGSMHACGHDLHVTGLVGAAKLLAARRDELPGSVIFMFQPGEEGAGGAAKMIAEGVLDAAGERPVAAYGVHVAAGRHGLFESRGGTIMAGANELHVTIHGKGGHGSQPATSVDPVPALLEFGLALQTMVTRRFSVFDPVVVTVTQLSGGKAVNVIPPSASLGATVRPLLRQQWCLDPRPRACHGFCRVCGLPPGITVKNVADSTIDRLWLSSRSPRRCRVAGEGGETCRSSRAGDVTVMRGRLSAL